MLWIIWPNLAYQLNTYTAIIRQIYHSVLIANLDNPSFPCETQNENATQGKM